MSQPHSNIQPDAHYLLERMEQQTIFRSHRTEWDRFTPILNDTIRDAKMSFRATGLLIYLLSLPPNWKASQSHISTVKTEGRDAVVSAWNELRDLGYLHKRTVRDAGRIVATEWHVFETPTHNFSEQSPFPDFPETVKPETVLPKTVNPGLRKKEVEERKNNETRISPIAPKGGGDEQSEITSSFKTKLQGFDEFWSAYPRKTGKEAAARAWATHKCSQRLAEILAAIESQKTWPQWNKAAGQFIPHPKTWINQHRWEDIGLPHDAARQTQEEGAF